MEGGQEGCCCGVEEGVVCGGVEESGPFGVD